jgi:hypothetical protein
MTKQIAAVAFLSVGMLFAANPPGVPKDAKETAPGQYTVTDRDGKTWVYRKTPFGIQKFQDKAAAQSPAAEAANKAAEAREASATATPGTTMPTPFGETKSRAAVPVKITEEGETLKFERQTPFGLQRWTRKKTELTDAEAAMWQAQRSNNSSANAK